MKELFVQHVEYSPEEKEAHYDLMDYINAFGWAITAGSISEDSFWKMCQRSKEENGCLFLKLSEYLKNKYGDLAKEKGRSEEFAFLELLEERAIECFAKHKGTKKRVSSNVDFYSGFVYEMIGLPQEIYTPLFAMARIVGWTAHRIEELNFEGKRIIRPAYKNVLEEQSYLPIADR